MVRGDAAGKKHPAFLNRLDQLHLRGIIGVEAKKIGGEDYGIFLAVRCARDNAVQFSRVNKP